jgi:tetratricopeptide (TPR) repeat protein
MAPRWWRGRSVLWILLAICVIAAAIPALRGGARPSIPVAAASLAITGFDLAHDSSDSLLASGLTTLVGAGLFESSPCRVVSGSKTLELRRRLGNAVAPLSPEAGTEVARQAHASLAVVGDVGREAGGYVASWRLVDVGTGNDLDAGRVRGGTQAALANQVVHAVAAAISKRMGVPSVAMETDAGVIVTASDSALREYQRAHMDLEVNNADSAYVHLERAVAADPEFALACLEMCDKRWQIWTQERSRAWAERAWALRRRLGLRDRLKAEAVLAGLRGNNEGEARTYQEILARWPDDLEATRAATSGLMWAHHFDESLTATTRALQQFPDDIDLLERHIFGLRCMGRTAGALATSRSWTKRSPSLLNSWAALGQCYLDAGEGDSARVALETSTQHDPDPWGSLVDYAGCAYVRGDLDGAIAMQESLCARPDMTSEHRAYVVLATAYGSLFELYVQGGRFTEALRAIDRAVAEASQAGAGTQTLRRVVSYKVFVLAESGRTDAALTLWREWKDRPDLDPRDVWEVEAWRAFALARSDSLRAARASANKLFDPQLWWFGAYRYRAYIQAAEVDLREGLADSALVHVGLARKKGLPPGGAFDWLARGLRAQALALQGRSTASIAAYDTLLHQYAGLAPAYLERARVHRRLGDRDAALADYDRFLELYARADADAPLLRPAREERRLLLAQH